MQTHSPEQLWNAKHVTVKSPEWYVVYSYEYVLRVVKTESQVHLLTLLLDQRDRFFDEEEEHLIFLNEDDEMNMAACWESYTSRIYQILTRAVTNRTPRPNDLEWMKTSFIEQYDDQSFLNNRLTNEPFSQHMQRIESIKMATFYYIYGNEER